MDENGWVNLDQLITNVKLSGQIINLDLIQQAVVNNDKQRFRLDLANNRIRANQGHSVKVDLELSERIPPEFLYHGTSIKTVQKIKEGGIKKMNRQQVHLSKDIQTAKIVGSRHGSPIVLIVSAQKMHDQGMKFYLSENGVWLTDYVHPDFIEFNKI
ncbi:MAG: RNA 2'-phosphotransferase [Saprospiraceae bacterium]